MKKPDGCRCGGDWAYMADPNVYDPNAAYFAEMFTYDGLGRPVTAGKTIDGNDISASVFAYNALGRLTSEKQTLFGGTQREVSYGYDQFGYRTSIGYPDGSTTINRTNAWTGQI
ncbi:MAG: RHS repeat protein, partial [Sedimentisphaerales bacterium]|nr:RHS repeat protein [Sedimentisphaerales bacterium]